MYSRFLFLLVAAICCAYLTSFAADRDEFGVGPFLGEPTGLNAQLFWDRHSSVDVGGAWSLSDQWLALTADFQRYNYIMDMPKEWKWYYGAGTYLTLARDDKDDNTFGIRVPLGLRYHFPYTIMDIWGELTPAVELAPATRGRVHGGIGLTFWLF